VDLAIAEEAEGLIYFNRGYHHLNDEAQAAEQETI
jgi:hypothetical protein